MIAITNPKRKMENLDSFDCKFLSIPLTYYVEN